MALSELEIIELVPNDQKEYYRGFLKYTSKRKDETHGIDLLQAQIEKGLTFKHDKYKEVINYPAYSILDNQGLIGVSSAKICIDQLIAEIDEKGWSILVCQRTEHIGALGYHLGILARKGIIAVGILSTHPVMCLPGGADRIVGNNIISIAIPKNPTPFIFDASLGECNVRQIVSWLNNDEHINYESIRCSESEHNTNLTHILESASIVPIGKHKGAGLALSIQCLLSALSGSSFLKAPKKLDEHCESQILIFALRPPCNFITNLSKEIAILKEKYPYIHIPGEQQ